MERFKEIFGGHNAILAMVCSLCLFLVKHWIGQVDARLDSVHDKAANSSARIAGIEERTQSFYRELSTGFGHVRDEQRIMNDKLDRLLTRR